jgi:hypothetical protein
VNAADRSSGATMRAYVEPACNSPTSTFSSRSLGGWLAKLAGVSMKSSCHSSSRRREKPKFITSLMSEVIAAVIGAFLGWFFGFAAAPIADSLT